MAVLKLDHLPGPAGTPEMLTRHAAPAARREGGQA